MWNLPLSVNANGVDFPIRNRCDYRVVLDTILALTDNELDEIQRIDCALFIFYQDIFPLKLLAIKDPQKHLSMAQTLIDKMVEIISLGEKSAKQNVKIMDWEKDFVRLAPPISRVLGYSVRDENKYTHWYDFIGAYQEVGECLFSTIVRIRLKKVKGKKLEKYEEEFYNENREIIDFQENLTAEEEEFLCSDW